MNPTIRAFYTAPASANITEMCFVFRSDDGLSQTSPDIFVPVYELELNVNIIFPDISPYFVDPGQSIEVVAESMQAQSISLYVDDVFIITAAGNSLIHTITASTLVDTKHWIKAVAVNGTNEVSDSVYYYVRGETQIASLPAGVRDGINYLSDDSVTLVLHAPYKSSVYAFGDFSDWQISPEFKLKRNYDEWNVFTRYWVTITGLTPGEEYAFQYLIDEELAVAEPYADKLLDPWNDSWIEESTYPNLKPYPAGKTTNIVSVLQTGQEEYVWQNSAFDPPAIGDLVIYEMLLRDFIEAHDFATLKDTLSYFKRLGINAIEIMPFSEFEGNSSWGYNPSFYFAPDKYYGPKNNLKAFIDECHENGIAVIMDMVLNHAFGQNVMARMYWDNENNRPAANNPWFNDICPHEPYCWGNDFNHESIFTQAFVDSVNNYWLTEYKVDGFRFDFTQGFTNSGTGGSYNSGRIATLIRMADEIWNDHPEAYIILEHWCDNTEEKELANYGMMLWGNHNYNYNEATMGWNANSDFSWISYKNRGWNDPHLVGFMESHDEERLMAKNINYGNSSGSYNIQDTTTALQRLELAGAFFFTVPGPKMTWQFADLGYDYHINYPGIIGGDDHRLDPKPIRWDYQNDYRRERLYNIFSALIHLKQNHEAFKTNDFTMNVAGAMKKIHLDHSSMNVTIIGNFDVVTGTIQPSFQHTGKWYDFFAGDSIDVANTSNPISLEAGEYRIYTDVKLVKPNLNLGFDQPDFATTNNSFVFPNPASGDFKIVFQNPETSEVEISILNSDGTSLATIFSGIVHAGKKEIRYNRTDPSVSMLRPGLYFVRISFENFSEVHKLVIQ
jgi:pullulanase/glycogen debranching enzyme